MRQGLRKSVLDRLQDMGGGNEARTRFLASLPGVKLVGRPALSGQDLGMIQAILEHRRSLAPRQEKQPFIRQHVPALPTYAEFKPSGERLASQMQRSGISSLKEY